jgi:teichuronic acid biosynthesis glycosyltransferase TuaC
MLQVVALSTLFPSAARPTFGVFVEGSLLRLAAEPDVRLTIIVPNGVPPWPLSAHKRYRALAALPRDEVWKGVRVIRPRFPLVPSLGWRLNPALVARAAAPFVLGADVIAAEFFFPDGLAAAALGRRFGIPYSIKARGADIHHWAAMPAIRPKAVAAARSAGGMLAVCQALRDDMVKLGMPGDRIRVHYTGVDLDRFRPVNRAVAKAELGVAGPLVASVGALIPRKAHHIVIDAVARLPGATLLIAGEGGERPMLEALIARLGAGERIRLLGNRPHAEVARLVAAADVFALASRREGLANAYVEALACGTPVVATPVDGAPEAIDRPAAGRLAEPTPNAFATAIAGLLAAPPDPRATRAVAEEKFAWDRHVAELKAHLQKVAQRCPSR